jgi:uncharacterized protein (DUF488 family)
MEFEKFIYTVGHSNRSIEEFIKPLKDHSINVIVDVRRFPKSKFPHFCGDELARIMKDLGIEYVYLGKELGGFRKGGYEVYMESDEFREGIKKLEAICTGKVCAIMCAERLYFKCHRRFISKYLESLGWKVVHLK